jgi:hypothetical protein
MRRQVSRSTINIFGSQSSFITLDIVLTKRRSASDDAMIADSGAYSYGLAYADVPSLEREWIRFVRPQPSHPHPYLNPIELQKLNCMCVYM